jgi:hypothetical protein
MDRDPKRVGGRSAGDKRGWSGWDLLCGNGLLRGSKVVWLRFGRIG